MFGVDGGVRGCLYRLHILGLLYYEQHRQSGKGSSKSLPGNASKNMLEILYTCELRRDCGSHYNTTIYNLPDTAVQFCRGNGQRNGNSATVRDLVPVEL